MQSQGNFSFVYSQLSKAFSSVDQKHSNYMGEEEFKLKLSQMSCEIPFLQIILEYGKLFSFFPTRELIQKKSQFGKEKNFDKLGAGGNATIFLCTDLTKNKYIAIKNMENFHINMLQNYIHECINQYNLIQISKDYILNFEGYVYIKIKNQQASLYMPLELAEYSLYDYIQDNEITQEIYQYFFNFFIDILILLHSNNYAHRDIKPQNILFVKGQGWKLADFGESIKYIKRLDLYRIQGTVAFLPSEIREKIKQNKEIKQDLYKNDVYAVICSLVMLKNPKFKSKELIEYMTSQKLEQQLLQLIVTVNQEQSIDQLQKLKTTCQKLNMEVFRPNQNLQNHQIDFDFDFKLVDQMRASYLYGLSLSNNFILSLDNELEKQSSDPHRYQKLMLNIILFHPYQIFQLENFALKELNHSLIRTKLSFYFDDIQVYSLYFINYCRDIMSVFRIAGQDLSLLKGLIDYCISKCDFKLAEELLQNFGRKMLNSDFNSDNYFSYNYHYQRIHGKTLLFDQNTQIFDPIILSDHKALITQINKNIVKELKLVDPHFQEKQNLIQLLQPLFEESTQKDQSSKNIICKDIIQSLGFNEIELGQNWPILVDAIKLQLVWGGAQLYQPFILQIINGLEKLFLNYDLFEGLLNLLHYFLTFMQYTNTTICQHIVSVIQINIFKSNLPKYHVKENLIRKNIYIEDINSKYYYLTKIYQLIQISKNILLYNLIIEQQKKEQVKIHCQKQLYCCLEEIIKRKNMNFYNDIVIFTQVKKYAVVLSLIESEYPKYLNQVILVICKYIYGVAIDQKLITLNVDKKELIVDFDPVLLQFYINCKQYHRIKLLIIQWRQFENTQLVYQEMVNPLAEIALMKQNNLNKKNSIFQFLYPEQLQRFVINQKFRLLFNYKQHLYAASIAKSAKKRLQVHNIALREQYLSI